MPKVISRPQTGQVEVVATEAVVEAQLMVKMWEQQLHRMLSPQKFVIHQTPEDRPIIPTPPPFKSHQAAILPMLGG